MSTPRHSIRASLAVLTASALILSPSLPALAVGPSTALNANDVAPGDYVAVTDTGTDFDIYGAPSRAVTVDAHDRISDRGEAFTQRIKLNGSGTAE
jgi:hypothetical protein